MARHGVATQGGARPGGARRVARPAKSEGVGPHLRNDPTTRLLEEIARTLLEIRDDIRVGFALLREPPKPLIPNAETIAAIEAAKRGEFVGGFKGVDALMVGLNALGD